MKEIQSVLDYYDQGPACGCGSRAKVDELIALKLIEVQQVKIHLEALEQKLTDIRANNAAIAHELAQNPNEPEGEFLIADYIIPIRNDAKK
ncbi:MAG: hypothetical protein KJ798_00170 [Gammaproteobacteria bacterium]|nr:hypothetical protein [Gammaproteobacteria bacterium]MBU0847798.1 hypothetical protein [Gammaproteobacteria bacterium]MBU1267068.1 hypothetical protein [Gammaproteobacteria bacterium]MBU1527942.1 hypothetical protein [Gammaproteobacteria bacterium]MBU1778773.1 hypothetical protein [Gammaproteobacteria bacterium]